MKRFLAIIFLLVIIANVCLADSSIIVPLGKYTDEEIVSMYETLKQELVNRGLEDSYKIPAGTYKVKSLLPVGLYRVSMANQNESLFLMNVQKSGENGKSRSYSYRLPESSYVIVDIQEDDETFYTYDDTVWAKEESPFN